MECTKLNQHHYPRYDTIYGTAEQCQDACLTKVPQCNAVNYAPSTVKHVKKGKCGFEHCQSLKKFGGTKHFNSYAYVGPDGAPTLPGKWIKIRSATQEKVNCEHLNHKRGQKPHYDTHYDNVETCQSACLNDVPRCNTVNFSPKENPQKKKFGKCQFEFCTPDYVVGGTKHYDSYMYSGQKVKSTTPPATATTTTVLWTLWSRSTQLGCEPLNDGRGATPKYNAVYSNLALCQAACQNDVPTCNAVNYAYQAGPDERVRGKCQFQYCDPSNEPRSERSAFFNAYRFSGSAPQTTFAAITSYDRDGWAKVDTPGRVNLGCEKLNAGRMHDRRFGPRYGTTYPGGVNECKLACQNEVTGCDAISYSAQNRGTCLFQQCGGVVVAGNARGYQSYFYNRPDRPERITRGTPATRPPLPSTVPPTRPPLPTTNAASTVAVSGSDATKPGMSPGSVAAIVVSILVVAGLAVGGVIVYLKVIKKSSDTSEGLVGS